MNDAVFTFLIYLGGIVGSIVFLKIFFSLWRLFEKTFHPEKFDSPPYTPETAFKDLHRRRVCIFLKDGSTITECTYVKTLFFGDSEFGLHHPVYFEVVDSVGRIIFVSGEEVSRIQTENES